MKINGKKWESLKDENKISYLDELFNESKSKLKKRHFEWYMNRMFLDGNHYSYYNTVTNTIEQKPRIRGEVRLVINKTRALVRAIQNFATREAPKWSTKPSDLDPETIQNAHRTEKFLDWLFKHLFMDTTIEGMIDQAMNTSIAWVEMGWDEEADDGLGQIYIKLHDSFDIFPDLGGYIDRGKYHGQFIFKAVKRPLSVVQNDGRYDKKKRKEVQSDDELAASEMKSRIIRKREGGYQNDKTKQVTVKECWLNDPEGEVKLITYAGGQVLRDEEVDEKEFPIYPMQIPLDPLNIFHRSWVADAIPLNKAIDRAVSQKIMYVNQALVFRILAEKGHGVNVFSNEHGEVLEINTNREFKQMSMQPLPTALDSLTNELALFEEDILGAHDAALGRLPAGARSGKTLEALQAADSNNLAGIIKGLRSALTVMGQKALEIAADKYVTSRIIEITDPEGGEGNYVKVVGEGASNAVKKKEDKKQVIIPRDTEVQVEIGSWLGYTRGEQRESLIKLAELGVIDSRELLRQFEFPNVEELSARAREERLEQHALKAEIAGRRGQQGGGEQPRGQSAGGIDMIALADKEMTRILNGEDLPPTEGATVDHIQAEQDFTKSRTFQSAPPDRQQAIVQHIRGELAEQGVV